MMVVVTCHSSPPPPLPLCSLSHQEASYGYWPTKLDEPKSYGKLTVTLKSEKEDREFVIRKFDITEDKVCDWSSSSEYILLVL